MKENDVTICALGADNLKELLIYGREIASQTGGNLTLLLALKAPYGETDARLLDGIYQQAKKYGADLVCAYSDEPECELLRRAAKADSGEVVVRAALPIAKKLYRALPDAEIHEFGRRNGFMAARAALGTI